MGDSGGGVGKSIQGSEPGDSGGGHPNPKITKEIICINLYGHADDAIAGKEASIAPLGAFLRSQGRQLKRDFILNVVSASRIGSPTQPPKSLRVLDYNAALGENANKALVKSLRSDWFASCAANVQQLFLITGYSSGGVTAIHMGRYLTEQNLNVFYVGLADAAFQRGESDYLRLKSGVKGKYLKNYYQTLENNESNPEIHDTVDGFSPFNLDSQVRGSANFHDAAVQIGNQRMFEDVMWCIENC
ncbi:MAG: hypothetical protein KDB01_03160 [Planctomycetaceae bacterium]|nr:hypothetical protein [Planctomycetaceae bacterium]